MEKGLRRIETDGGIERVSPVAMTVRKRVVEVDMLMKGPNKLLKV